MEIGRFGRSLVAEITLCKEATDLIHGFESWVAEPYLDPIGLPTVGWGHLIIRREYEQFGVVKDGKRFRLIDPAGHALTREQGDALFMRDLARFLAGVDELCQVPLSEMQFGAIVSFAFNCGLGNLRASTLRRRVNSGDHADVPYQFSRWNKAGGRVLRGLTRRRKAEGDLYRRGS